jgi:hypothetical protein
MNDTEGYRPNALYRTLASHYRALADMLKRDPLPGMRTTFATITGEIHATGIVDAFRSFARSCYGAERQQADAMPPPPELKRNSRGTGSYRVPGGENNRPFGKKVGNLWMLGLAAGGAACVFYRLPPSASATRRSPITDTLRRETGFETSGNLSRRTLASQGPVDQSAVVFHQAW